jgi:calcineurin-like phosphoesterase
MPVKFDTADEDVWVNGVVVDVREDGLANSIEQVLVPAP